MEKQASLGMGIMKLRRIAGAWRNKRMGIAYIWVQRSGIPKSPKTCSQFRAIKLVADFFLLLILWWLTLIRLPSQWVSQPSERPCDFSFSAPSVSFVGPSLLVISKTPRLQDHRHSHLVPHFEECSINVRVYPQNQGSWVPANLALLGPSFQGGNKKSRWKHSFHREILKTFHRGKTQDQMIFT